MGSSLLSCAMAKLVNAFRNRRSIVANLCARAAGLLLVGLLAHSASALPVTYTMVVTGSFPDESPSGTLGKVAFGWPTCACSITLKFEGDTANVINFSSPVSGHELLMGTATVTVTNPSTGMVLAHGTFLPSAGIFISIDNSNGGIGFGSFGVLPSDPSFPGQPGYPWAMVPFSGVGVVDSAAYTYDLSSNITFTSYSAFACVDFPVTCATPLSLPTTEGPLTIAPGNYVRNGAFTAVVHPPVKFTRFSAETSFNRSTDDLDVAGRLTLGRKSNGINPVTDAVTLAVNGVPFVVRAGSFTFNEGDNPYYSFLGQVGPFTTLNMRILPVGANSYEYFAVIQGSDFSAIDPSASVTLTIGDDSGSTTATHLDE